MFEETSHRVMRDAFFEMIAKEYVDEPHMIAKVNEMRDTVVKTYFSREGFVNALPSLKYRDIVIKDIQGRRYGNDILINVGSFRRIESSTPSDPGDGLLFRVIFTIVLAGLLEERGLTLKLDLDSLSEWWFLPNNICCRLLNESKLEILIKMIEGMISIYQGTSSEQLQSPFKELQAMSPEELEGVIESWISNVLYMFSTIKFESRGIIEDLMTLKKIFESMQKDSNYCSQTVPDGACEFQDRDAASRLFSLQEARVTIDVSKYIQWAIRFYSNKERITKPPIDLAQKYTEKAGDRPSTGAAREVSHNPDVVSIVTTSQNVTHSRRWKRSKRRKSKKKGGKLKKCEKKGKTKKKKRKKTKRN